MDDLDQLSAAALARPAQLPAIEFHKRWISWGEMRQVGERVGDLIVASGAGPGTRVAFVARNRPSALAALVGMIARRCTIRMVYPFQSATAIARDLDGIEPSVLVAAAEDYSEAILAVVSPIPNPISRIFGAFRPKTASRSRNPAEKGIPKRGMSIS